MSHQVDGDSSPCTTSMDEIVPAVACLCFVLDFSLHAGCLSQGQLLCCSVDLALCRITGDENGQHVNCCNGNSFLTRELVCLQERIQFCCVGARCSLPKVKEMPSLITCCYFTMYSDNGFGPYSCCQSIKSIRTSQATAKNTRTAPQKDDSTLSTARSEEALSPVHQRPSKMPALLLLLPETVSRASTSTGTVGVLVSNISGQLTSITMPDDCSDNGYFP